MKRVPAVAALALFALAWAPSCVVRQQAPKPTLESDVRELMQELSVLPPFPEPDRRSGSLWSDGGPGAALFKDPRAYRINDLVTIQLDERSLGTNESGTDLNRSSESDFGAPIAFGLEDVNPTAGKFSLNQVLQTSSESTFSGDGATTRSSQLIASLTVRVLRVLSNGDLVVAGQKNVVVNRERQVLTLVGSIRSVDISADNRVPSSAVGDLTVRLWGHGEIDNTIRQGWFMRVMNRVWPF